jgi:hypothetical protein
VVVVVVVVCPGGGRWGGWCDMAVSGGGDGPGLRVRGVGHVAHKYAAKMLENVLRTCCFREKCS